MKKKTALVLVAAAICALFALSLSACFGPSEKKFSYMEFEITATDEFKQKSVGTPSKDADILGKSGVLAFESNDILVVVSRVKRDDFNAYNVFDLKGLVAYTIDGYDEENPEVEYVDEGDSYYAAYVMNYTDSNGNDSVQYEVLCESKDYFYEVAFVAFSEDYPSCKDEIIKIAKSARVKGGFVREGVKAKAFENSGLTLNLDSTFSETGADSGAQYTNGYIGVTVTSTDESIVSLQGLKNYVNEVTEQNFNYSDAKTKDGVKFAYTEFTYNDEDGKELYNYAALFIGTQGGYIVEFTVDNEIAYYFADTVESLASATSGKVLDDYSNNPVEVTAKTFEVSAKYFDFKITLDNSYFDFIPVEENVTELSESGVVRAYSSEHNYYYFATAYSETELIYTYGSSDFDNFLTEQKESFGVNESIDTADGWKILTDSETTAAAYKEVKGGIAMLQLGCYLFTPRELGELQRAAATYEVTITAPDMTPEDVKIGALKFTLDNSFELFSSDGLDSYYSYVTGIDFSVDVLAETGSPFGYTLEKFCDEILKDFGADNTDTIDAGDGYMLYNGLIKGGEIRYFMYFSKTKDFYVCQYYIVPNSGIKAVNDLYLKTTTQFAKSLVQE